MAGVTIHPPGTAPASPDPETPSQRIVRAAREVKVIEDSLGRRIGYRRLGPVEAMDLQEIAGAANVQNIAWMTYATIAYSVVEIDGEKIGRPSSKTQLRALVARLGDEGIDAIFSEIMPKAADGDDGEDEASPGMAEAKN